MKFNYVQKMLYMFLSVIFCTIIHFVEVGNCDETDDQVDRLIKNQSMPDGVMTDHFRDFLKRAVVVKERFTKEGIDYLFKEKIFEFPDINESDFATYQHIIRINIVDTVRSGNSSDDNSTNNKKFISEVCINNCFDGSTCISTGGSVSFEFFDNGDVAFYRDSRKNKIPVSNTIRFYPNTRIIHRINVTNYDKHYTRIITWNKKGKFESDEKSYFIGSEEWHKEQLELQKQLKQKRKKEEEDDE